MNEQQLNKPSLTFFVAISRYSFKRKISTLFSFYSLFGCSGLYPITQQRFHLYELCMSFV